MKFDFIENRGFISGGILNFTPKEIFELCSKGAIIVDVRSEYVNKSRKFKVDNVLYFPLDKLEQTYTELPKDKLLIFADSVGLRSKEAVILLKEKAIENIANMAGGLVEWERDGLPIEIDLSEQLTGSCMCQLKNRNKK